MIEIDYDFRLEVRAGDDDLRDHLTFTKLCLKFGSDSISSIQIVTIYLELGIVLTTHCTVTSTEHHIVLRDFRYGLTVSTHLVTDLNQTDVTFV